MSFSDYLAKRPRTNGPSEEFTRAMRADPQLPEIETWPELQAYLFRRHGTRVKELIAGAEPVWKGYRAYVLKSRRST